MKQMIPHRAPWAHQWKKAFALLACRRAAAAVEFALIVPAILVALTGLVGFGLVVYQNMQLTNAAQAAAQLAIIDASNPAAIATAAANATDLPITADNVTINQFCECAGAAAVCGIACPSGRDPSQMMTITVTMDADLLFWGGAIALNQSATVRTQ